MSRSAIDDFEFVLSLLSKKMVEGRRRNNSPGVVFLLGAGCSRQYGLPSFWELLANIWEDCFKKPPDSSWSLEVLRGRIDRYWHSESPDYLRKRLEYYLKRVDGSTCAGYRRLARLAKSGYVHAVVNMNFDTLLEEAFEAEGFHNYEVSTTFSKIIRKEGEAPSHPKLVVYKPHGSIGRVDAKAGGLSREYGQEFILDIANSDLFARTEEQRGAKTLLTQSDVVIVGYSGGDAKMVDALRGPSPDDDPRDRKLFVANVAPPNPRLLPAISERTSHYLSIIGEDAAFENFMEHLEKCVIPEKSRKSPGRHRKRIPLDGETNYMTRAERDSLTHCLQLAQNIRLSMNVAERSTISIEEHGNAIFRDCLRLARNAGICLSSPEKYLLHCAAFLHDLGYYRGYTRSRVAENPGLKLLLDHGRMTCELLSEQFREDPDVVKKIIPGTYCSSNGIYDQLKKLLCEFCANHSGIGQVSCKNVSIQVAGVDTPIRVELIIALFALAEELSEGHPFLPSPDPVGPKAEENDYALVDPILDLYLRRKRAAVDFTIDRGRVTGKVLQKGRGSDKPNKTVIWFLSLAASLVGKLDEISRREGGWGMQFETPNFELPQNKLEPDLLREALEERLDESLTVAVRELATDRKPRPPQAGEMSSLLDLIAIYSLNPLSGGLQMPAFYYEKGPESGDPKTKKEHIEPRVDLSRSGIVGRALDVLVERRSDNFWGVPQGVLQFYFPMKRRGAQGIMEKVFFESFERIIHPAWRFFARNWHDGIEELLMARACLDLGSSRFRSEVVGGLKHILSEKVEWVTRESACGHGGCTLCTSRLLYVLSLIRRLFPRHEISKFSGKPRGKTLDSTVQGIICFMLNRDRKGDREAWLGLDIRGGERSPYDIRSADYLAWAVRSVGTCLSIDQELNEKVREDWLAGCGINRSEVEGLFRSRLLHLFSLRYGQLLSDQAEEPHSFVLGRVSLACFDLWNMGGEVLRIRKENEAEEEIFLQELFRACDNVVQGGVSQMSRMYLWPAMLLRDAKEEHRTAELIDLCYRCIRSRIWIPTGPDAGSWGFNVKNTQTIIMALVGFWRYVLGDERRRERFAAGFEELDSREPLVSFEESVSPAIPLVQKRRARKTKIH